MRFYLACLFSVCVLLATRTSYSADPGVDAPAGALKVLFIGNSYTARHNLADLVEAMTAERHPELVFEKKTVIYGGRKLVDHWRLGSQNFLKSGSVTADEIESTIKRLSAGLKKDSKDKYAKYAVERQRKLLRELDSTRTRWDVVVLQSYRDDLEGDASAYAEYARKFAEVAKAEGTRIVLYETTPTTQNDKPLRAKPAPEPVMAKAKLIAKLADDIGASVAPMSLVGMKCQTERPDLTLRFVNDAHLNQTMAYLTACSLYAAIFDEDPSGIQVNSVTDIRYWENKDRTRDRDNKPITRVFSASDRADLQRIAWEGYQELKQIRSGAVGQ